MLYTIIFPRNRKDLFASPRTIFANKLKFEKCAPKITRFLIGSFVCSRKVETAGEIGEMQGAVDAFLRLASSPEARVSAHALLSEQLKVTTHA